MLPRDDPAGGRPPEARFFPPGGDLTGGPGSGLPGCQRTCRTGWQFLMWAGSCLLVKSIVSGYAPRWQVDCYQDYNEAGHEISRARDRAGAVATASLRLG